VRDNRGEEIKFHFRVDHFSHTYDIGYQSL
jgi:hypothetical protein